MSTVWFAVHDRFCMLLIVWAATTTVFVESDLVKRFVWIPVSVGLAGVLGTMFMLDIPANVILIAHVATLAVFIISFKVLKKDRVSLPFRIKHREG